MPGQWSVSAEIRAEQKAALKNMSFKKKLAYFWEYYRFHTLVAVIAAIAIYSIFNSIANAKPYSFSAMMLNAYGLDGGLIAEDFCAYADLDTENFTCFIDTNSALNVDEYSQYDMATSQKIIALSMAGDIDVMVCDGPTFAYYADSEMFVDLRTVLSAEEIGRYEEYFFYVDQAVIDEKKAAEPDFTDSTVKTDEEKKAELAKRHEPASMKVPVPVGIFVTDAPFIRETGSYFLFEPVFGIFKSSPRVENAILYLKYLFIFPRQ